MFLALISCLKMLYCWDDSRPAYLISHRNVMILVKKCLNGWGLIFQKQSFRRKLLNDLHSSRRQ